MADTAQLLTLGLAGVGSGGNVADAPELGAVVTASSIPVVTAAGEAIVTDDTYLLDNSFEILTDAAGSFLTP